ncbi:MAG TPA: hypothetical protein VGL48_07840 [Acidimicrobiales bacterium]
MGHDGKAQTTGGPTCPERVLHLLGRSKTGLTANDMRRDTVIATFGPSTLSRAISGLRAQGKVEEAGKRGREGIFRVAEQEPSAPPPGPVQKKAAKVVEDLSNPKIREAFKAAFAEQKATRETEAAVRAAEKEVEAARAEQEKRQLAAEREALRLAEAARDMPHKSSKYWEEIIGAVNAATEVLARYFRDFDDLPPLTLAHLRLLDRALDDMRGQLHRFEKKLHPEGRTGTVKKGTVIDV